MQPKPHLPTRSEPVKFPSHIQNATRQFPPDPGYELRQLLSGTQDDASAKAEAVPDPADRRCSRSAWLLEMLSILASIGCMAGVIVILARMRDQPLTKWTVVLNLNSTIAVLITALKSWAMLAVASCLSQNKWEYFRKGPARLRQLDVFDEASRGPLGACRLLWSLRTRLNIALLGAVVTIVVLGVDAFAQQLITFDSRVEPVDNNGTALLLVTDTYDGGAKAREQIMIPTVAESSTVDTTMQGAIYRGLYGSTSSPPFNCSSQCLWPGTNRSLGFASQCADVTTVAMATLKHTPFGNGTHSQRVVTPGNVTLDYINSPTSFHPAVVVAAKDLTPKRFNPGEVYTPEFARVGILRMRETDKNQDQDYWYLGANVSEIIECTVRFTAYEYSDIRTSGSTLTVGKTTQIPLGAGYKYDMDTRKKTWFAVFNQTQSSSPPFRIATPDMGALAEFFTTNRFSGSIFDGESAPASSGMGTAFLKGNIPALFDNMAQSMTDHLRSGYKNAQEVQGKTLVAVTIVRVHWVWLALPIGVLVLATLFLGITIWDSWGSRGKLWKSSVVAALYHQVTWKTGSGGVLSTDLQSVKELERLAEETSLVYP